MDSSPSSAPGTAAVDTEVPQKGSEVGSRDVVMKEAPAETVDESKDQANSTEAPATNGETAHKSDEPSEGPEDPSSLPDETEVNDTSELNVGADAAPSSAPAAANGTPTTVKRASNGGSSKKKTGVPEHKTKKLQKKKSRPMTNLDAEPGRYYFARMKGHPPWPSIICDEEMLPISLLTTRPVTARLPDGTYKKTEYEDGGKRAHERTFPVMFLHTNEFAWIPNTELTPLDLDDESVKNPVEKGKSKTLLLAYNKAAEGNDLLHFKTMIADHIKALEEDQAEREERAAKKAKKASRKSTEVVAPAEEDEMDVDEEEAASKPKSKKRKKTEDDEVEGKPAKTPKTTTKLKLSEPKTPTDSAIKKKTSKPKAKTTKSSSEDDAAALKAEETPMTPEAALGMKERKVLYFRHKLQRSMLNRDSMPKEEEMKPMSDFLSELETYPDLEASIIRKTKIHKVLKNIIKLNNIPLEEEFHFKDRSRELLTKWNDILNNDPSGAAGDGADDKADDKADDPKADVPPPVTNGASAAAAPETESKEKIENKIGTSVEGEKESEKPAAEAKAQEAEETAEEKATDGPAIDSKPEAEYKPPDSTETAAEDTA